MTLSVKSIKAAACSAVLAGMLLAIGAASASAATFAPAGAGFQGDSNAVSFVSSNPSTGVTFRVTCSKSRFSGTLQNPAAGTASIAAAAFSFNNGAGVPCSFVMDGVGVVGTATVTPQAASALVANSTSSVSLRFGTVDILVDDIWGNPNCHLTIANLTQATGTWSNASSTLTITNKPITITGVGSSCSVFASAPSKTVTATYAVTNTTNPGTPITVQP